MNQKSTELPLHKSHVRLGDDGMQGGILFFVLFAALLPVAFLAALTRWHWQPWPPGRSGYKTFIHEAKVAARDATATVLSV